MTNARWQDAETVAQTLGVSRNQLMRLASRYHVPVIRVNRRDARFDAIAIAALEDACRCTSAADETPARSKSTVRSVPPVQKPGSEFASAQDLTMKLLREKKQSTSNGKSSAGTTSASVHRLERSRKPTNHT